MEKTILFKLKETEPNIGFELECIDHLVDVQDSDVYCFIKDETKMYRKIYNQALEILGSKENLGNILTENEEDLLFGSEVEHAIIIPKVFINRDIKIHSKIISIKEKHIVKNHIPTKFVVTDKNQNKVERKMKNKVLVIAKTNTTDGFGTQLFDENPTCDCCFSKLNLEKSKVKKLIEFLVTSDEECKDVVITEVIINNNFIGQELNFGENNIYTFKKKHVLNTTSIDALSTIANAKDEESTKQMCKILGVDYKEYIEFSKMMDKTLEPMSKENLEKMLTEVNNTDGIEPDLYVSPVTLDDKNEYSIIDNNVFKQPLLNILKEFNLTNGGETDDLIILDSIAADIRVVAELIFKVTSSKSITVIYFGDYYYISCNKNSKEMTYQEKNKMDEILLRYSGAVLYIINK